MKIRSLPGLLQVCLRRPAESLPLSSQTSRATSQKMMPGGPSPDDILATCEVFRQKTMINARDDAAFTDWGFMLFQVVIMHEDQDKKASLLKDSIDKLDKAIKINSCAKGEQGVYAQHILANAWFLSFMLEKDDAAADGHLNKMKRAIRQGMIVDNTNGEMQQLEASLPSVHEQRRQAQEQIKRLGGMSEDEKRTELMKMQIDQLNQALLAKRQEVGMATAQQRKPLLLELAGILLECALIQTKRKEGIALLKEAADAAKQATDSADPELTIRSLFLQTLLFSALSYAELDRGQVAVHQRMSQEAFDKLCDSPEMRRPGARAELEGQRAQMSERYKAWKAQMLDPTDGGKPTGTAPEPASSASKRAAPAPAGPAAAGGAGAGGAGAGAAGKEDEMLGFLVLAGGLLVVGGLVWLYSRRKD